MKHADRIKECASTDPRRGVNEPHGRASNLTREGLQGTSPLPFRALKTKTFSGKQSSFEWTDGPLGLSGARRIPGQPSSGRTAPASGRGYCPFNFERYAGKKLTPLYLIRYTLFKWGRRSRKYRRFFTAQAVGQSQSGTGLRTCQRQTAAFLVLILP
jgi:hypothetical protein